MMKTDEELLTDMIAGNQDAFAHLVKRYQKKILNLGYQFSRNQFAAEDLAQEIFLKMWKAAPDFRSQSKFSTWLYRIAVNTCLNYKKTKKELTATDLDSTNLRNYENSAADTTNPAMISENLQRSQMVSLAVADLPANQRMTIILSRFEEYSYHEIASIMNISRSAVESLLFRAKQNLLKKLSKIK
jgi:RNA polymerase sigma-70 factor (ECF subfamily)